jgi:hypothetical protein
MMQKRIKYPLLSLLLFLLASCSVEIPKDIIQPSQLEALLYDYHLVQAMSTDASDEYKRRLYAAFVFDKHKVSKEYFDSSMMWYARNPKYLHKIYNTLYDKIDAEIALMSGEKRMANVEVNPLSGDTVDLWSDAKVMLLTSSPYFRRKTFAYEADTTFVDGDSIAFSAVLHFISPEGKPKAQAHIALLAEYADSTSSATGLTIDKDGYYVVELPRNSASSIKKVSAHLYFMPSDSADDERLLVGALSLVRIHPEAKVEE